MTQSNLFEYRDFSPGISEDPDDIERSWTAWKFHESRSRYVAYHLAQLTEKRTYPMTD